MLWKICLESESLPDTTNGFTSGHLDNSRVLSNIKHLEKELELFMLILPTLPKNVTDVIVGIQSDILDSLDVSLVGIQLTPTSMEQGILHDDILEICAGLQ